MTTWSVVVAGWMSQEVAEQFAHSLEMQLSAVGLPRITIKVIKEPKKPN